MKKRVIVLSLTILLLSACSNQTLLTEPNVDSSSVNVDPSSVNVEQASPILMPTPSSAETPSVPISPVIYPDIDNLEFADLTDFVFWFASGAGAWSTEVRILPDGTFHGKHWDTDAGSTGPDFPEGTRYFCSFSGKFSSLKKTDEYEYSMKCEFLTQEGVVGEEEIIDGVRYITSDPYGFDNADMFFLYLPGKDINGLPEEFLNWVGMPRGIDYKSIDILDFYGLYNVGGEEGFSASVNGNNAAYIKAYREFLLNTDMDSDDDTGFPVRGYYLFDLDFDNIPELGVFHDSLGSMGGYFTFYRFDRNRIIPILNSESLPARCSNYTQLLADFENEKVYFLKEMYLLQGNNNGTYGYVREVVIQNQELYVYNILDLEVDPESDLKRHYEKSYASEDDFLSDTELDECLITQYNSNSGWEEISSKEYLMYKRELIPDENTFVDLRDTDVYHLGSTEEMLDEADGIYKNIQMTSEEMDVLFTKWLESN